MISKHRRQLRHRRKGLGDPTSAPNTDFKNVCECVCVWIENKDSMLKLVWEQLSRHNKSRSREQLNVFNYLYIFNYHLTVRCSIKHVWMIARSLWSLLYLCFGWTNQRNVLWQSVLLRTNKLSQTEQNISHGIHEVSHRISNGIFHGIFHGIPHGISHGISHGMVARCLSLGA